jgi:hypothetical protein
VSRYAVCLSIGSSRRRRDATRFYRSRIPAFFLQVRRTPAGPGRTVMQTELEGKSRFGRCPYCRAMIYQDLNATIFYCSRCRTPIRGMKDELLLARDVVSCWLLCSPTRPPPPEHDRLTASPPALVQARTRNPRTRPSTRLIESKE